LTRLTSELAVRVGELVTALKFDAEERLRQEEEKQEQEKLDLELGKAKAEAEEKMTISKDRLRKAGSLARVAARMKMQGKARDAIGGGKTVSSGKVVPFPRGEQPVKFFSPAASPRAGEFELQQPPEDVSAGLMTR
jgi:hypothetical protein